MTLLPLVTGEDSINPQLVNIRNVLEVSKVVKYQIGRIPRNLVPHNMRTWKILEDHLQITGSASYEKLVILAKNHDHPRGGKGFIDYCIRNGWLVEADSVPLVPQSEAYAPSAKSEPSGVIVHPNEQPMALAEGQQSATTESLLQDYIQGFFGYGSLSAPLWFIGMEEGIGKESLEDRLNAWHDLGHADTVDIRLFHERIQETRWFSFLATLQNTWRRLIIVALRYLNEPVDKERVRRYQVGELATKTEALLELLPLPHKGLSDWNHQGLFANRDAYLATIAPKRLAALQNAVASHAPKAVIMYGTTPPYPEYWRKLAGGSLTTTEQGWSHRRSGQTIYVVCQHPVAHGVNDNYYASIGDFIRGASDS